VEPRKTNSHSRGDHHGGLGGGGGLPERAVVTTEPLEPFQSPTTLPSSSTTILPSLCSLPMIWPSGPLTTEPYSVQSDANS
jgi:hypothetical protein